MISCWKHKSLPTQDCSSSSLFGDEVIEQNKDSGEVSTHTTFSQSLI